MGTRERLIDAAEGLIREQGIGSVTTKAVARATGLAEATLYRHFPDKTALLLALFGERMPGAFLEQLAALPTLTGTRTVAANLEALVAAAVSFFIQTAPLTAAVDADPALAARHYGRLRELGAGPDVARGALVAYLRGEQRGGRVHADADVEVAATLLLGICFQQAHAHYVFGQGGADFSPQRFAAGIVGLVLTGLSPPG